MKVFLDIETIPTQNEKIKQCIAEKVTHPATMKKAETIEKWEQESKPQAIEEAVRKTGLNGAFGEIVSIACAIDDGEVKAFYLDDWQQADREEIILSQFFNYVNENYTPCCDLPPCFIGFNSVAFDLKFIHQRSVVNKVKPCGRFPVNPKAWDNNVYDVMVEYAGFGKYISLNDMALSLGIDGKGDIQGSDVWQYVQDGRIKEVAEYNKHDVEVTRELYKRLNFIE
ncbi:ribonuclease H-like domain-containing protein [Phocoenobacter skyensis]|uniref:Predicted 3'-5' exonuclease PolB-like domain-containing protein n=1 Tax=Phocoenobacter skyensis TaxID=97481 RepID=A0A1H7XMT2_9PAST|nr:ribonuclease H-like domain-containing protein [Pasteurella skyensis]MDP8184368.1 ribonuclease H-like domain-containing protein [Pasteurella skyensis]QLB22624.1 hypothetical protein A6B44_05150 [Pasteurella skyensis]SEM34497.1 hypothetical protein SAMN05444853_11325 [Pasteurella skyensis]